MAWLSSSSRSPAGKGIRESLAEELGREKEGSVRIRVLVQVLRYLARCIISPQYFLVV